MRLDIAGVGVDNLIKNEILEKIKVFFESNKQHLVFTPNPEMVVDTQRDNFFKEALEKSSLSVADGFGLVIAAKFLYNHSLQRLTGVELMDQICRLASQDNKSIYLVGGKVGIAQDAAKKLKIKYPNLKIVGAEEGIELCNCEKAPGILLNKEENDSLIQRIQNAKPDILFIAFGHGKQEKWLAEFISVLPSVKIGMGVGGAFDFIAEKVMRAPKIMQTTGLEWLWRFIIQPFRFNRIWNATAVFTYIVLEYKRRMKLPYRYGAIGYVINNEGKFFIAKRNDKNKSEHWQPPQGGIDIGETPEQAVVREVKEETGMNTKIICGAKTTIKYDWHNFNNLSLFRYYKYRGAIKSIFLLKFEGSDNEIALDQNELIDYKWVTLEELKNIIHPLRKNSLDILINECLQYIKE